MEWRFTSDAPIYSQLVAQIKLAIISGVMEEGSRLPSVRDMAVEAGVNPNTMQRALTDLERDGLVYSQRTSGRFVTEDKKMVEEVKTQLAQEQIRQFIGKMTLLGYRKNEIITMIEKEEADNGSI